jgi:hypothetical protein
MHGGCSFCGGRIECPVLNHSMMMTQVIRLRNSTICLSRIRTVLPSDSTKVAGLLAGAASRKGGRVSRALGSSAGRVRPWRDSRPCQTSSVLAGFGGRAASVPRPRRAVTECLLVAFAKAMPVVLKCGRRDRRIAEARMAFRIGSAACCDVAACRFNSIMKAVTRNLCPGWRRRRRIVCNRLRMRAGSQRQGKEQCGKCEQFFHSEVPQSSGCAVRFECEIDAPLLEPDMAENVAK